MRVLRMILWSCVTVSMLMSAEVTLVAGGGMQPNGNGLRVFNSSVQLKIVIAEGPGPQPDPNGSGAVGMGGVS